MRKLLVLAIVVALVLGYGYYRAASRGWLYVSLLDSSVKPYGGNIRNAELRLLDGSGRLLAEARSDDKFGVVRHIHPEVGDCAAEETGAASSLESRERWQQCFKTLSTWLIDWADRIRFADVKFGQCDIKKIPVTVRESRDDWWLWWVPLPHIGGDPMTYFSVSITVDGASCVAAKPPTAQTSTDPRNSSSR